MRRYTAPFLAVAFALALTTMMIPATVGAQYSPQGHQATPIVCEGDLIPIIIGGQVVGCREQAPSPCHQDDFREAILPFFFENETDDPRCPDDEGEPDYTSGAECIAIGVLATAGGPVALQQLAAESTAQQEPTFGSASSDAQVHDATVTPGPTSAATVTSSCDVTHGADLSEWEVRATAQVEGLEVRTFLPPFLQTQLDVLREELVLTEFGPTYSCLKTALDVGGSGPPANLCAGPNFTTTIPLFFGTVTVTQDERTGPFFLPDGRVLYTGAALHVTAVEFITGNVLADIYIGYVAAVVPTR